MTSRDGGKSEIHLMIVFTDVCTPQGYAQTSPPGRSTPAPWREDSELKTLSPEPESFQPFPAILPGPRDPNVTAAMGMTGSGQPYNG
jgi:hypothetical protein